jgi:hypothetical protein
MPEVSRFFGIAIRMYFSDHDPPHFHAAYGEREALIAIETLAVLRGGLPRRALALVLEWAVLHRDDLRANWESGRLGERLASIEPLD